ncbi:MAG: flagellar basal body rod protein FlgC [Oceanococcaceae bacterium]
MASFATLQVAGQALAAQSLRLNTVASNMANADAVSGDPNAVYQPRHPVFQTVLTESGAVGVAVSEIQTETAAPQQRYMPGHPDADEKGYVYAPNVDIVEAMADMLSAARSYQSSLELMNTSKDLLLRTLETGRG